MAEPQYRERRELPDQEFDAIVEKLISEAPGGMDEQSFNRWLKFRLNEAVGTAENRAPEPQGGAAGRFAAGAWEMLNPIEMVKGVYGALPIPQALGGSGVIEGPVNTVKGLVGAQLEQFPKAYQAISRPASGPREFVSNVGEASGRLLAGTVPILGPMAAQVGERIGEGDVAGGLGAATGVLAPMGAPTAIRAGVRVGRKIAPTGVRNRVAARAENWANENIAQIATPPGKNKTNIKMGRDVAEQAPRVAQMLVEEGAPWTREGLHQQISGKLADAEATLDSAADARFKTDTFETQPIIDGLLEKRKAMTSEAVVASEITPKVEPPPASAVKAHAADKAKVAKGERDYFLRWLQKDLEEMSFQAQPGAAKWGKSDATRNIKSSATIGFEVENQGIGVGSARVAGTPTQAMLHKLGITGSRAEQAAKIEKYLSGKTKNPKLDAIGDALREAFDPEAGFDFSKVSAETRARLHPKWKDKDFEQPMVGPHVDEANQGFAARVDPVEVPFEVMPTPDPVAPQGTKTAVPYGKDVVPGPNRPRVAKIDQMIAEVKALGPRAHYEAIRRIRQAYDLEAKATYNAAVTPNYLEVNMSKLGARDGTGVLRDHLAKMDGGTAAANAEYHVWRTVDDVLEAAQEQARTSPKIFRSVMARTIGVLVGSGGGGVPGAIAGAAMAPALERALSSSTTGLKTARTLTRLAAAIRRQDAGAVNSLTADLRGQIKSAAKRTVPQAAVAASTSQQQPALAQ